MTPRTRPFAKTASVLACGLALYASPAAAERQGFQTPSGNILCFLENGASELDVFCLILQAEWPFPDAQEDCDTDRFRAVQLGRNWPAEARTICSSDVFWPYPTATLGYGSTWSIEGFSCTIERDGVACTDDFGPGSFRVSRGALDLN